MKILILEGTSKLGGAQFDNILIQKSTNAKYEYTTIVPDSGDLFKILSKDNKDVEVLSPPVFLSTSVLIGAKKILNPLAILTNILGYVFFSIKLSNTF